MNDIEVGEFVRIKHELNQTIIAKITEFIGIDPNYKNMAMYKIDRIAHHGSSCYPTKEIYEEDIIKHSKNIIDVLEVGDFVNGKEIKRINDYEDFKRADFNLDYDDCDAVYNENIKSILTHEQYEANSYKLEE